MQFGQVVISAIVGGVIGFGASQLSGQGEDTGPTVETVVTAAVDARLADIGMTNKADLDGRISGGVAQFLSDNPAAVVAALEKYQEQQEALEEQKRRDAVSNLSEDLIKQVGDPSFGADAATATATVVEFFDYRCGYCKRALDGVIALADEDKKVRVVLKEFPILGPESVVAARASLAANLVDSKLHMGFHEALMRHRGDYDKTTLLSLAAMAGYDPASIATTMESKEVTALIRKNYETAEALGIRGTPAFVIGDKVIPGAVSQSIMQDAIRNARAS